MPPPTPDEPPDREPLWAIPLNDLVPPPPPQAPPAPVPVPVPDDDIQFLRFVLDIPPADFQPRLNRFDEAA